VILLKKIKLINLLRFEGKNRDKRKLNKENVNCLLYFSLIFRPHDPDQVIDTKIETDETSTETNQDL